MSEQFERVEPTPFTAPEAKPGAAAPGPGSGERPRWLLPALGGLALLALAVIFLLPTLVGTPDPAPVAPGSSSGNAERSAAAPGSKRDPAEESAASAASPFADAVEAKARAAAQDVLAELLDVQEGLIERGAESWAAETMSAIAAVAQRGDELYRERQFDEALAQYETALDDALALEQSLPERFAEQLAATRDAIERFDREGAQESLALAELLEPGDPALTALQARVAALPEVAAAAEEAFAAEAGDDLEAAVSRMEAAAALDTAHQRVATELARLREALTDARFNRAMTEGYAALQDSAFDQAQERFEYAARLRPDASEAAAALTELSVARTADTLRRLKARGETLLEKESWGEAIDVFEEALAIDASLRFAREGIAVARPRGELSAELNAIIDEPGRLVDDAILGEAQRSLSRARELPNPGPKLSALISRAGDTLTAASTPVTITLQSDGLTAVTVYKVARLGEFSERQLTLRPGTYTAVGTRRGYRDVRREFTVTAGGLAAPAFIACSETI